MSALKKLQKHFPKVREVVDAKESIVINVTKRDSSSATKKDPFNCAMVKACKRTGIADGALIGISYSYLVKGDTATRYKTSNNVQREIVSFDRHHHFASGENYRLSKISPTNKLDRKRHRSGRGGDNQPPTAIHHTAFIRKVTKI